MKENFTSTEFTEIATPKLSFLPEKGFTRKHSLEYNSSTVCNLVYAGSHVAFVVSLDIRDQCIDDMVVKVCDGALCDEFVQGGYSSSLYEYLVQHKGYRGSPSGYYKATDNPRATKLEHRLNGFVSLLLNVGTCLLEDKLDVFMGLDPDEPILGRS